jgi:hypothetical protein
MMKWLTSNLLPLSILAAICILVFVASFVRIRFVKPNWLLLGIGTVLLVAVGVGVIIVLRNPPGQIDVIDEKDLPGPNPEVAKTTLDRLRLAWNSQDVANWPASDTLAEVSEIAYQPPHQAEQSYQKLGFSTILPIVQGSMIGYIITGENVTVVAFRGTDFNEVSDWLANLDRSATETPHGEVHQGFYLAYQSMKSQVDAILQERDTTHLWVTGHSLGGALALLCAYDLEEVEKRTVNGVITFGQPMVARRKFATYIDSMLAGRYARFVNRNDLVPKVPPSHVACGSLVWFTDGGVKRSKLRQVMYSAEPRDGLPMAVRGEIKLAEESDEEAEITPLTDAEFEALQAKLKSETAAIESVPTERLPVEIELEKTKIGKTAVVEPNTEPRPMMAYQVKSTMLIDDHSMLLYHQKIRQLLGFNNP